MPKKPMKKATKATTAKKAAPKKSKSVVAVAAPAPTGMWKILEMKKAQLKMSEQARSEGRSHIHNNGQTFQSHPRDPRFAKFAGPRRKVG